MAIICFILLATVHVSIFLVSSLPILILQLIEWLTVCPIYYIVTGKKYHEKYNKICDMIFDLLFLDRPYYIKDNEPKHASYTEHLVYGKDSDYHDNDFYTRLWRKIMKINLNLDYK
jgi:hypothetical protein